MQSNGEVFLITLHAEISVCILHAGAEVRRKLLSGKCVTSVSKLVKNVLHR